MGKSYEALIGNTKRPLLHNDKVLAIQNDRLRARNELLSERLTESEAGRQTYRELNLELTQQMYEEEDVTGSHRYDTRDKGRADGLEEQNY
jgi:hypothetical protein